MWLQTSCLISVKNFMTFSNESNNANHTNHSMNSDQETGSSTSLCSYFPAGYAERRCPDAERLLATRMRFLFSVSFPGNLDRRVLVEQAWPIPASTHDRR
jgi:hypothetical protein